MRAGNMSVISPYGWSGGPKSRLTSTTPDVGGIVTGGRDAVPTCCSVNLGSTPGMADISMQRSTSTAIRLASCRSTRDGERARYSDPFPLESSPSSRPASRNSSSPSMLIIPGRLLGTRTKLTYTEPWSLPTRWSTSARWA